MHGVAMEVASEHREDVSVPCDHVEFLRTALEPVVVHEVDSRDEGRVMLNNDSLRTGGELLIKGVETLGGKQAAVGIRSHGVHNEETRPAIGQHNVVLEFPVDRGERREGPASGRGDGAYRVAIVVVPGNKQEWQLGSGEQIGEVLVLRRVGVIDEVAAQDDEIWGESSRLLKSDGEAAGGVDAALHELSVRVDMGVADLNDEHTSTLGCVRGC